MECFGTFQEDRICSLCGKVTPIIHIMCRNALRDEIADRTNLVKIRDNCRFRSTQYDECTRFDACALHGNGHGKNADQCSPKLECKEYMEQEAE